MMGAVCSAARLEAALKESDSLVDLPSDRSEPLWAELRLECQAVWTVLVFQVRPRSPFQQRRFR